MHISFGIEWQFGKSVKQGIEADLFALLDEIEKSGTLRQAAGTLGMSYRHAWGLLKKWEERFQKPLVNLKRGRHSGTHLTELARQLLDEKNKLMHELSPILEQHSNDVNEHLALCLSTDIPSAINLHASHDIALNYLLELLEQEQTGLVQLHTQGSLDNLKTLARKGCDVAGFHFPVATEQDDIYEHYERWLRNKSYSYLQLTIRTQGLMIARKNPKKIRRLKDLTKRSVRFINRQPESGTRTLLDSLLLKNQIATKSINGYKQEEFTHIAVAAMIASGAADVGMGLEAAARQFDLDFIPLIEEKYMLAFASDINRETKNKLIEAIHSKAFKSRLAKLSGYKLPSTETEISRQSLFQ